MYRDSMDGQMSDMEREFELEMENEFEFEAEDSDGEFEDYEDEFEQTDDETDEEFEADSRDEYEWFAANGSGYGERFYELTQQEFESESEMDEAVGRILTEMEHEFFLGNIWKKAKNAATGLAKKGMALAKKAGINLPSLDALKSMLGPVSGLLKGNLGTLFKTALAAHPAGAALLPALKGFGLETSEDAGDNREAFERYASVAREAFENLAETINSNADNPLEASRLATNAFQKSLKNHQNAPRAKPRFGAATRVKKRVRRVYAAPDEIIVVIQRKR